MPINEQGYLEFKPASVFKPFLPKNQPKGTRYLALYGGRGGAKSHFFAEQIIRYALMRPGLRVACVREIQSSIKLSSKKLIEDKIHEHGLEDYFTIQERTIKTPGDGYIAFLGLQDYNAKAAKGLERIDVCWIDEAEAITLNSWQILEPSIRAKGSQIWASWNPLDRNDAIDDFFRCNGDHPATKPPANAIIKEVSWRSNPWFKNTPLEASRKHCMETQRPEVYQNIWEGAYATVSDAQVFRGKYQIKEFTAPEGMNFYFGADWGYSPDPTVCVRCYIYDSQLWIDYEVVAKETYTPSLPSLFSAIPLAMECPIYGDPAGKHIIEELKGLYGMNITQAEKWAGSVEEGVQYLQGFKKINIHPRCIFTAREFKYYSYQIDKRTGSPKQPLKLEDANNHAIDAIRYALNKVIKQARGIDWTQVDDPVIDQIEEGFPEEGYFGY